MNTIRESIQSGGLDRVTDATGVQFIWTISRHGEVLLHLDSGAVWAVHLGDSGKVGDTGLTFLDNNNSNHYIPWAKIEYMETHVAHKE